MRDQKNRLITKDRLITPVSKPMLIPSGLDVCDTCGTESVKIKSDDEAPKDDKTQE